MARVRSGTARLQRRAQPAPSALPTHNDHAELTWQQVTRERERLAHCEKYPVLSSLEKTWEVIDSLYDGIVKRDERTAEYPFDALLLYVEMGFYPPPELLLAVAGAYRTYIGAAGRLTLEEVFFGRPRRRSGTSAQRQAQRKKWHGIAVEFDLLIRQGHSKIRAAELISERLGGKPEPESIVRMLSSARSKRTKKGV